MMKDSGVRSCVADSGQKPAAYVAASFVRKDVTLHSGEHMVVMIGNTGCMARGQSARVLVYRQTAKDYRLVYDGVSLPEEADAGTDGTLSLPTHETFDTIFEPMYVWNGTAYAFSPLRSDVYDLPLQMRRPYRLPIRFSPGTSSTILRGSAAENFGQGYSFAARKGQRVAIQILDPKKRFPAVSLWLGDRDVALIDGNRWSGVLASDGTYTLDVFGPDGARDDVLVPYAIRLEIR